MSLFYDDDVFAWANNLEPKATLLINGSKPSYYKTYENPYTVTIKANNGYKVGNVSGGGYDPITDVLAPYFNIEGNDARAKFTANNDFNFKNYTVEIIEGEPTPDITITNKFISTITEANTFLKINDNVVTAGESFNYPVRLELHPTQDNVLLVKAYARRYDPITDSYPEMVLDSDRNVLYFDATNSRPFPIDTTWYITTDIKTPDVKGFNDVYLLTNQQVNEIVNNSYFSVGDDGGKIDYREFIISLIDLPFNIPDELLAGTKKVSLGNYETDVIATIVNTDKLTVNLGTISYSPDEGNSYDYMGVTCNLHLPFVNPVAIEPQYIVNETIRIEYVINLYNSNVTINIYSSKIDGVILSTNTVLNSQIPFRIQEVNPTGNNPKNVQFANDNGVTRPFLEVLKNKTILPYGFFTIPITDETEISNVSGYVEIENINLRGNILNNEQSELTNLLKQGVIINV